MVAGAKGDTPEVVCQYLNTPCDTYSDTTNVEYALRCLVLNLTKIVGNGVGVLYLGARALCIAEGLRRFSDIIYTFFFFFGFESTQLARQLQQERTQMEVH